jgi:mannose-1-phosphate guanylyltransferase
MVNKENIYCIIMAGGIGSRFWPMSRNNKPKQFLDILGTGSSLIRQTFDRVSNFCNAENIYIVTSESHKDQVLEHLPEINVEHVLLEPMRRNTAPCIAFATHKIAQRNPNAVIVVAPSDHLVLNETAFLKTISTAINFAAENDSLLTIGIKPSRPETGYGYIQIGKPEGSSGSNLFKVKTFTEKPNVEMANVFLNSGEFFWNSGLFIWSLPAIQKALDEHIPEIQALFHDAVPHFGTNKESEAIVNVYSQCRNVSIDYGVMEKASNVYVICAEFGWSDLGTWGSLYLSSNKDALNNAVVGNNVMLHNVKNCLVNIPQEKLVVLEGLEDFIVVESDEILLVCRKEKEQDIKTYLNEVIAEKGDKFA